MEDSILLQLFIVGILWGGTNPFMKAATTSGDKRKKKSPCVPENLFSELSNQLSDWNYLVPFVINQCGSLLFYYTLPYSDISLAVPIANGVSLVSTSIVGTLIGEEKPKLKAMVGIVFLLFGIGCLVTDKKT